MDNIFKTYEQLYINRRNEDNNKFINLFNELKVLKNIHFQKQYIDDGILFCPFFDDFFGKRYKFKLVFDQFGTWFSKRIVIVGAKNMFGAGYIDENIFEISDNTNYTLFLNTAKNKWNYKNF